MSMSSRWDSVVEAMAAHHHKHSANMPGAVFAAETRTDGPFVDSVGPGWKADTICEIGSMTKPFISAAVLLALEERDMLDIEVPVCRLPGMDIWAGHPMKAESDCAMSFSTLRASLTFESILNGPRRGATLRRELHPPVLIRSWISVRPRHGSVPPP